MINIKTPNEISIMATGGRILAEVLSEVLGEVKVGVSELELDRLAEKLIRQKGGEPGFKTVEGYHHAICVSTNDVVVHGIPTNYRLKGGDIVGIDCGVYYKGFHTDMAETIQIKNEKLTLRQSLGQEIKNKNEKIKKFLDRGKKALIEAIKQAKVGNRVGHISKTIQDIVEGADDPSADGDGARLSREARSCSAGHDKRGQGYSVVRSLVGHGVGKRLHEEPEVPGFLATKIEYTPMLREGMTIAIEVIYNMGSPEVVYANDGWTIKTKDGSISGLFERTVAITEEGPLVLTQA